MSNCADLILKSTHIYPGCGNQLLSGAVAIAGNRIVYVGHENNMAEWIGAETKVIDCGEKLILPGLHDAHMHFFLAALYDSGLVHVSFDDKSADECARGLMKLAQKTDADQWLIGAGWYHTLWTVPELPDKTVLDKYYADRPVCLFSFDCHTLWLNTAGLEKLGLNAATKDPQGGKFDRYANGELTGILHDAAATAELRRILVFSDAQIEQFYLKFLKRLNSLGITSICDMSLMALPGGDFIFDRVYEKLLENQKLSVRVHLYPTLTDDLSRPLEMRSRYQSSMLRCNGVKQFFDGTSACHTAFLKEPYANAYYPGDCGCTTMPPEKMRELIFSAIRNDFSVRIHAIGDQSVHLLLDDFEEANRVFGKKACLQHTIEHLEDVLPEDFSRFAALHVIPSVQPAHLVYDPIGIPTDLGPERARLTWPFRTLIDHGAKLAFGTDCPVVDVDPFCNLYSAVTRKSADRGDGIVWYAEECISVFEAINAYTEGAARAANRSNELGTLQPGKLADVIVLDQNILNCEDEDILATKVLLTVCNGKIVYER